jgi:hypothetical protein
MKTTIGFEAIRSASKVAIECGQEFEVQVEYSVANIGDCANLSEAEQQKMTRGLGFELDQKARARCAENDACSWYEVVKGETVNNVCAPNGQGVRVWTSKWSFTVKCVP